MKYLLNEEEYQEYQDKILINDRNNEIFDKLITKNIEELLESFRVESINLNTRNYYYKANKIEMTDIIRDLIVFYENFDRYYDVKVNFIEEFY